MPRDVPVPLLVLLGVALLTVALPGCLTEEDAPEQDPRSEVFEGQAQERLQAWQAIERAALGRGNATTDPGELSKTALQEEVGMRRLARVVAPTVEELARDDPYASVGILLEEIVLEGASWYAAYHTCLLEAVSSRECEDRARPLVQIMETLKEVSSSTHATDGSGSPLTR